MSYVELSADHGAEGEALLKLHLEPAQPIEVGELTAALGSIARQYQRFAIDEGWGEKQGDDRLLVASVSPGSIDINFLPDLHALAATVGPLIPAMLSDYELVEKFAKRLKRLLDLFLGEAGAPGEHQPTLRDCDDAINIVNPIAQHGGTQSFTTVKGDVHNTILNIDVNQARQILNNSLSVKAGFVPVSGDKRQRVALVWNKLARDEAKTKGKRSPDQAIIAELDDKPHPVFFTDEMSYLKREMIDDDEENPFEKVYFVDVEVSRVPGGGVGNYRVTAFHGSDDLEPPSTSGTSLPFA